MRNSTQPTTLSVRPFWLLAVVLAAGVVQAQAPRVLPPETLPDDARLGPLTTLNDYFPFTPPESPEAWDIRSERARRQLLVATGLWPIPTKTPANAVVHGTVDRDGYTVERVYLESFPGHFVTGNLYRPKGKSGRLPGVLCPHGHWANGRFYDAGEAGLAKELEAGREEFDPAGRYVTQSRCVQLARMGCVVFHYDMVGYADSVQIDHRPGLRESMNTAENWGYFSPQAELRMQNMMGLQTYNSLRTLDWFLTLPDIDADRVAVTGASGGGTQTFMLSAIDPRPAVSFPAVMVSTAMQGGCTCENACYLRTDSGNIEIAALFAPRPLGMSGANDWSLEIETKGLPELQSLYKTLGVDDLVMAKCFPNFPHNYNYVSRAVMYGWFNKHLNLGFEEPIVETDYEPLSVEEMTVWNDAHPKPSAADADYERSLLAWIEADSQKQMAALAPTDADSLAEYRRIVGGAVDVMIGHGLPESPSKADPPVEIEDKGDHYLIKLLIRNEPREEELPAILLGPKQWNKQVVVWIDQQGKRSLFDEQGQLTAAVKKLLAEEFVVVGVDLLGQGEFTADGKPLETARLVDNGNGAWQKFAGYTFGYNHPLFSKRVQDVLSVVSYLQHEEHNSQQIHLVGLAGAGHWVAAAKAQAGDAVDRVVVDTAGFRFADINRFDHPDFLPGAAKYLDLPGVLALAAPGELWLSGEGDEGPSIVRAAYESSGHAGRLTVSNDGSADAAIDWLLR